MKRVMIIGGPGSGKSTLARRLHAITGLPVYHLDAHFWQPGWIKPPEHQFRALISTLAARDRWIIDGNYSKTFEVRMRRADTIFWLDFPRRIRMPRIIKRLARNYGRVREEDIAPRCKERIDLPFLKWAWTFGPAHAPSFNHALSTHGASAKYYIMTSQFEVDGFLRSMNR